MIGICDVKVQAENPSMPLYPLRAFVDSPSSIRIRNVPKQIGNWKINNVYFQVNYPDGTIKTVGCLPINNIWIGTVDGTADSGIVKNGFTVFADGVDENGNAVSNYILGKGDITILEADGTITPGQDARCVHLVDAQPDEPKEGDLWQLSGSWYIYQDGQAWPIGDESGLIQQLSAEVQTKADVSSLSDYELKADMPQDVSSIVLSTENIFSDWNIVVPAGVPDYYVLGPNYPEFYPNSAEDQTIGTWTVQLYNPEDPSDFYTWESDNQQSISALTLDLPISEPYGVLLPNLSATRTVESKNALGLVLEQQLSTKQDKLTDAQISAIDSVVDERATVIEFQFAPPRAYNWSGEINKQTMIDAGLYDDTQGSWNETPTAIKIGTAVTRLGNYVFDGCEALTKVDIPSSVSSVGDYAFQDCASLPEITLPQSVKSIGVDAFAGTVSYFKLYLEEAIPTFVPGTPNYPWGVSNTANIITVRNATIEWVEEQAYGKGFLWRNTSVNARNTCSLNPFYINALTLAAARASFKVTMNTITATIARDTYFALTIGNFTQPMTWDTPFDMFEGGSAAAIAPKPNTTNIYHIFEYASGHFMVSKFSSALDELGDIETIVNAI